METHSYKLSIDKELLIQLGFSIEEQQILLNIFNNHGKITSSVLAGLGFCYKDAKRLQYLYDIVIGKVVINSPDEISKHFKKMNDNIQRIGINSLPLSRLNKVPRLAVVGGLPEGSYSIYNSKNGKEGVRMYPVNGLSDKRVIIITRRKPVLPYGSEKKLYSIKDKARERIYYSEDSKKISSKIKDNDMIEIEVALEIRKITQDKKVEVAIDKRFTRIINRFLIIGSLREPEFHHGLYMVIAYDGTKIYIYGQTMKQSEYVQYNRNSQRVYDFGFDQKQLHLKLEKVAKEIYAYLNGVYVELIPPNTDFIPYDKQEGNRKKESEKEEIEL